MKRMLLTGFEPFQGVETNPSELVVSALQNKRFLNCELITEILPVSYERGDTRMRQLIQEHQPDVILAVGVASKIEKIHLERVALNLDDASIPDNDGDLRSGVEIQPGAPHAYFATLPLTQMLSVLQEVDIPARISNHAGAFLCNHVFFRASQSVAKSELQSQVGFVHIPLPVELNEGNGMPLSMIIQAIERIVDLLANDDLGAIHPS